MSVKIGAIVLTYSDRREYLFTVVEKLLEECFQEITIICNGVSEEVGTDICNRYLEYSEVNILSNEENLGSSGGFSRGLSEASLDLDYVLLLDDDNSIPPGLIRKINSEVLKNETGDDVILFCMRSDRKKLSLAVSSGCPWLPVGKRNSAYGVNLFNLFSSVEHCDSELIVAPYSGLVIPVKVLRKRLFPDEKLFLYCDDYEYTYRLIFKHGFKLRVIQDLNIEDLEKSFNQARSSRFSSRFASANKLQLYYSIRNERFFSKNRADNIVFYNINYFVAILYFLSTFLLRAEFSRISTLTKAIYHSLRKLYGRREI